MGSRYKHLARQLLLFFPFHHKNQIEYFRHRQQLLVLHILFDSYDEKEKRVKVVLQGACNTTLTLFSFSS